MNSRLTIGRRAVCRAVAEAASAGARTEGSFAPSRDGEGAGGGDAPPEPGRSAPPAQAAAIEAASNAPAIRSQGVSVLPVISVEVYHRRVDQKGMIGLFRCTSFLTS